MAPSSHWASPASGGQTSVDLRGAPWVLGCRVPNRHAKRCSSTPSLASAVIAYSATAADRAHRVDQRIPKALCLEACEAVRRMRALVRGPIYIDLRTMDQKVRVRVPSGYIRLVVVSLGRDSHISGSSGCCAARLFASLARSEGPRFLADHRCFQRCACRNEAMGRRWGARCRLWRTDPEHGGWAFDLRLAGPDGLMQWVRRYGFASRADAEREGGRQPRS